MKKPYIFIIFLVYISGFIWYGFEKGDLNNEAKQLSLQLKEELQSNYPNLFSSKSEENKPGYTSLFADCEKLSSQKNNCVFKRIHQYITNKAVYPQSALNDGTQGVVFIRFVKAKDGKVSKIQIKGEDERLNKEARRVIASLPKMEGVQDGKSIRYSIRIKFKIDLNKQPIVGLYIYV